jgi:glucose dehydrogenase
MKRMLMVSVSAMVAAAGSASAGPVTADDLLKAQDNGKEWLTYGRDYRNWRYSPLDEITPETAPKLTPVWAMSTGWATRSGI